MKYYNLVTEQSSGPKMSHAVQSFKTAIARILTLKVMSLQALKYLIPHVSVSPLDQSLLKVDDKAPLLQHCLLSRSEQISM